MQSFFRDWLTVAWRQRSGNGGGKEVVERHCCSTRAGGREVGGREV